MKPLRVNLFCWGDSNDINTWSNVPYFFTRALISRKVDVRRLNLIPERGPVHRALEVLSSNFNRVASKCGLRPRPLFRIPAFHRLVNFHLARTCRRFHDADLNLFLTFSFSSYRYSDVPVAHYCDRTYEHHLAELGIRPRHVDRRLIRMEKRNLQNARYVFNFNRACLEFIRDHYGVSNVLLLNAGLNLGDDEFPDPSTLIARKEAARDILFIGRGFHHRGVDILLEAFQRFNARLPDPFTLHLVGVANRGVSEPQAHVVCHGYLRKDDPTQYRQYMELLASARLFVFPMRFGPLPGVLREALWMCTPVILTNVPNASERLQDGKNGILAATADPEEFARWMSTLVADRERWRRMAGYARESVRDNTWGATIDRFLEVIGWTPGQADAALSHRTCRNETPLASGTLSG
jgi:glycosyltransferase involved in cell wall biosynthesis